MRSYQARCRVLGYLGRRRRSSDQRRKDSIMNRLDSRTLRTLRCRQTSVDRAKVAIRLAGLLGHGSHTLKGSHSGHGFVRRSGASPQYGQNWIGVSDYSRSADGVEEAAENRIVASAQMVLQWRLRNAQRGSFTQGSHKQPLTRRALDIK